MAGKTLCYGVHDQAGYLRGEYLARSRDDVERAVKMEWGDAPMRIERYPVGTWGDSADDPLIRSYDLTTNEGWAAIPMEQDHAA